MVSAAMPGRLRRSTRDRELVTPEGIRLPIVLASRGARAGALIMDLMFVGILQFVTTLLLASIAFGGPERWNSCSCCGSRRCSCSATPGSCSSS